MDRNKQEKVQTEDSYQTLFWVFCKSYSAKSIKAYLGFICRKKNGNTQGPYPTVSMELNTPDLELHCSDDSCKGIRFFSVPLNVFFQAQENIFWRKYFKRK